MSSAVGQSRRRKHLRRAGSDVLSALVIIVVIGIGLYYGMVTIMTGDPLWFSTSFSATPRQITIIDRGQRTEIGPSDPRFAPLVDAFNRSIEQGYYKGSLSFSEPTWELAEQNGLFVEMTYAEPVRLHGGYVPARQLRMLIDGDLIHTVEVLFRNGGERWDRAPIRMKDIEPLKQVLERYELNS